MQARTNFEIAESLAELAKEIDDAKIQFEPITHVYAPLFVNQAHNFAKALAGDRANELYDETE